MNTNDFLKRLLFLLLFPLLIFRCGNSPFKKEKQELLKQDSSVYATQNFSDLRVDSLQIAGMVLHDHALDSFYSLIFDFYRRRDFQAAWFTDNCFTTQGHDFVNRLRNYIEIYGDSAVLGDRLLLTADSVVLNPRLGFNVVQSRPLLDILLTSTFFKYANREYYGTNSSTRDLEWYIPRKKKNYLQLIDALIHSDSSYSIYEPLSPAYAALKKHLIVYRKIQKQGGLPFVDSATLLLKLGDSSAHLITLKKYLFQTGDLSIGDSTSYYTPALSSAISAFQGRMGLAISGKLDLITRNELNVAIENRILQIMVNLERLRWAPDSLPRDYLVINIPEFKLHVIEENANLWDMRIIVGKGASVTSIFSGHLSQIIFRPYWNVPQSIIVKEMLPVLRNDPGYIIRQHMEVLSNGNLVSPYSINWKSYKKSVPFLIRQQPGKDNALGLILFNFNNPFDIYMHDTPAKGLFAADKRAFSHGCIRLEDAAKLAKYIYRRDSTFTDEKLRTLMTEGKETKYAVRPSIAVFVGYFTAWSDADGRLNFRKDVYELDNKLANEIFVKIRQF